MDATESTPLRVDLGRFYRPVCVGLTLLFAAYGLFILWTLVTAPWFVTFGTDRAIYVTATERWLAGGPFYYPEQLAGPYHLRVGHVLYPPVALWFFVPASFLPPLLWWAIPLTIVGAVIVHHRPAPWAWPLIAACLGFQWSVMLLATGNPTLWLSAAVALATLRGGWAVAVLAKPTLFPFALVGIRRRWWWLALGLFVLACLPFGAMWLDWWTAVTNAYGWRVGLLYSLGDVPWLLAPVIARAAS